MRTRPFLAECARSIKKARSVEYPFPVLRRNMAQSGRRRYIRQDLRLFARPLALVDTLIESLLGACFGRAACLSLQGTSQIPRRENSGPLRGAKASRSTSAVVGRVHVVSLVRLSAR